MIPFAIIARKNMDNNQFCKFVEIAFKSNNPNNFLENLYKANISVQEIREFLQKNCFTNVREFYYLAQDLK